MELFKTVMQNAMFDSLENSLSEYFGPFKRKMMSKDARLSIVRAHSRTIHRNATNIRVTRKDNASMFISFDIKNVRYKCLWNELKQTITDRSVIDIATS